MATSAKMPAPSAAPSGGGGRVRMEGACNSSDASNPRIAGTCAADGKRFFSRAEHELQLLRRLHSIHVNQQSLGFPVG